MARLLATLAILLISIPVTAQAPQATMPTIDWAVWGAIGAAHAADYALTRECINTPQKCHEAVLPEALQGKAALAFTEAGFSGAQIAISYELRKHHHVKIAKIFDYLNLAGFTGDDVYLVKLLQ